MATFKDILSQGWQNLQSWKQVATNPQLRADYKQYVVKPTIAPFRATNTIGVGQFNYQPLKPAVKAVAQKLQQFPDTTIKYQAPKFNPIGLNKSVSPVNAVPFLSGMVGSQMRDYGSTIEKLNENKKLNFWDAANISDFIPGLGFIGLGGIKKVGQEGLEKIGKEGLENIGEKAFKTGVQGMQPRQQLKNLIQYSDQLHRLGYTVKEIEKIGLEEGRQIIQNAIPAVKKAQDIVQNLSVKSKVGILDYLRTPDRVLSKMGLANEASQIRSSWDNYLSQLPKEIDKVTAWSKRVAPEANERIFDFLDGKKVSLADNELTVANEIKTYLKGWAAKLGLPEDRQISNYITHIFERGQIEQEFDPEMAKILRETVAGSVFDPFLQARKDAPEYVHDTWRALDAYIKRATRKTNMDPILKKVSDIADNLETSQYNYIKKYLDRINLRPTDIDNMLDNSIKQIFGYKFGQRPTTVITQKMRQATYRGLLGLNPKSALRNLTQGANTYSELGEKYTLKGYYEVVKNMPAFLTGKQTELEAVGVLRDGFIQDRTISAVKSFWQKTDKVLFYMFELAEKINRGAAYYGAKAKGLKQGLSEQKAIEYAKDIVRKTQFTFGSIDTPAVFASDVNKTLLQFMSYSGKQAEFLGEKIASKDIAGLTRYILSNLVIAWTVGEAVGIDWTNMIPSVRLGVPPTLQAPWGALQVALGTKDKYGAEPDPNLLKRTLENQNLQQGLINYFPAGSQIKKTIEGVGAYNRGYSQTRSGNVRFPIEPTTGNRVKTTLLGQYSTKEARDYFDTNSRPLSEKQTEAFKKNREVYNQVMEKRANDNLLEKAKSLVEQTGSPSYVGSSYLYHDPETGDIKTIDLAFEPTKPEFTGSKLVDKELLSKFNSQVTKRKNIILDSFQQGLITAEEAEKQLSDLASLKLSVTAKAGTKTGSAKKITIKAAKQPIFKISKPKAIATNIRIKSPPKPAKFKTNTIKISKSKIPTLKVAKLPSMKVSKKGSLFA